MVWSAPGSNIRPLPALDSDLVDRLCDLFDSCAAAATQPRGPFSPVDGAARPLMLSPEAVGLRRRLYVQMCAVLERWQVSDPAALDAAGLAELTGIAAPFILDTRAFEGGASEADPVRPAQLRQARASWERALDVPASRVRSGESAASAMSRLHSGVSNRDAYARGLADLAKGHARADTYFFLAPYAIGRFRRTPPPAYAALTAPETFAVGKVMRALDAGLDLPQIIALLPLAIQYRAQDLTQRIYAFQVAVLHLLDGDRLPEALPLGPPVAEADVAGLGACEAVLHLVSAAIEVATEGCAEMGRNAAPSHSGPREWGARMA